MEVFAFVFLLMPVAASALIAPMKTSAGKVDMNSVLTHVLLLEQTVSGLTKSQCRKSDVEFVKQMFVNSSLELTSVKEQLMKVTSELNLVKSNQKDTGSQHDFVAFQVKAKTHPTIVNNKQVLKFDTVTLNTGGSYHPTTGIFEAPVTGMYLFYANIMSYDSGALFINLMKEGVKLVTGFSSRELQYGVATISYIVEVNNGEKVWFVKPRETRNIYGNFFSMYGGILLYGL